MLLTITIYSTWTVDAAPPPCPLPRSWTVDGVPWSCCGGGSGTLVCPSSEKTSDAADTVSLIGAECDRLLPHSDAEGRLAARRRCDLVCCRGLSRAAGSDP